MPLGGTYSTGTIAATNASSAIVGTGVLWRDVLEGDWLWVPSQDAFGVVDSVNGTFDGITLKANWTGATASGLSYFVLKMSWLRYDPSITQATTRKLLDYLSGAGLIYYVTGAAPDPGLGDDGQFAVKISGSPTLTLTWWSKVSGVWVPQGTLSPSLTFLGFVAAATRAALPTNAYFNGTNNDGIGATLTATANGALTVDNYAAVANDVLLVQGEASAAHNGLYTVTAAGDASHPYILTRVSFFNQVSNIFAGCWVFVQHGLDNAGFAFAMTTQGGVTVGTTAINWNSFAPVGLPNPVAPYAVGDLLYANTTSSLARLADVAAGAVLVSGGVGAPPAWSRSPTLDGLTLNPTAGTVNPGLQVNHSLPLVGSQAGSINLNAIIVSPDNYDLSGGANALAIIYNYGGANLHGSRGGLYVQTSLNTATPNNPAGLCFYVAAEFLAQGWVASGGTDLSAMGARGSLIGVNPVAKALSSATNLGEVTGCEINVAIESGATARGRFGLRITELATAAVQGVSYGSGANFADAGIQFTSQGGAVGLRNGIVFDALWGQAPIATNGKAIAVIGAQTMDTFIDAYLATVSNLFINGPAGNFIVAGSGDTEIATSAHFGWPGRARVFSPGDAVIRLCDSTGTSWSRLILGSNDASGIALVKSGTNLQFTLGDGTGDAGLVRAIIKGTAGAGYIEYQSQSSGPAAPSSGYRKYADSTGRISWIRASDGFARTFDSVLTANRVYTFQDASYTLIGRDTTDTLTNKTFDTAGTGNVFKINGVTISSNTGTGANVLAASPTLTGIANIAAVVVNGTAGAGYIEYQPQSSAPGAPATGYRKYADSTGRISWIRASDGFVRTFDSVLTANRVYTFQDASYTLIGRDTTDTLTNKTFDTAGAGNVLKINGTTISSNTGTGANVLAASPTLTGTPNIAAATATTLQIGSTAPAGNKVIQIDAGGAGTARYVSIKNTVGEALYGVDGGGNTNCYALTGSTIFGTDTGFDVNFYANGLLAFSIIQGASLAAEQVRVRATQAATSTTTGALRVDGGVGCAGDLWLGGGAVVGAATGGNKGAGTINVAGDIYKNNTAYTNPDYVLEHAFTGTIERFAGNPGAGRYRGLVPLAELDAYLRGKLRLPGVDDEPAGVFARGDIALEKIEESWLYIVQLKAENDNLKQRIAALEAA